MVMGLVIVVVMVVVVMEMVVVVMEMVVTVVMERSLEQSLILPPRSF